MLGLAFLVPCTGLENSPSKKRTKKDCEILVFLFWRCCLWIRVWAQFWWLPDFFELSFFHRVPIWWPVHRRKELQNPNRQAFIKSLWTIPKSGCFCPANTVSLRVLSLTKTALTVGHLMTGVEKSLFLFFEWSLQLNLAKLLGQREDCFW